MSTRTHEQYAEDQVRRYPNLTVAELISAERTEMALHAAVSVVVYGLISWGLWAYASPDWAKGAGFAYLGFLLAEVMEYNGRIRAFKRLTLED
jgi:hypothetical protein